MKNDLQAIAAMFCALSLIIVNTLLFSVAAQSLARVAYRAGLTSDAAQWTIFIMAILLCIGTFLSLAGRVVDGRWWFFR